MSTYQKQLTSILWLGVPAALFFFLDFAMKLLFPVQTADSLDALALGVALLFFFLPTLLWGIFSRLFYPQKNYGTLAKGSLYVAGSIFLLSATRLFPPEETFWEDLITVFLFMFLSQLISANIGLFLGTLLKRINRHSQQSLSVSNSDVKSAA